MRILHVRHPLPPGIAHSTTQFTSPRDLPRNLNILHHTLLRRELTIPTARQTPRLVKHLLTAAVAGVAALLGVRLRALGDGDHGVLGPDVDGLGPVEAFDAAAFDGDDVFGWGGVEEAGSAVAAEVAALVSNSLPLLAT